MQYLAKNHILPPQGVDFNFGGDWSTLHFHDYWEFILITDSCTHIINNQKIPLNKGNALIVRPQDKHKFVDSKNTISQFNIKITNELESEVRSIRKSFFENFVHLVNVQRIDLFFGRYAYRTFVVRIHTLL